MNDSRAIPSWVVLLVAVAALVLATAGLTATVVGRSPFSGSFGFPIMGGFPMMGGSGMMRGAYGTGSTGGDPGPGASGFVPGTTSSPRTIRVFAGPGYSFTPATIAVRKGETVTFAVTTMGPTTHEFMVGPADAVATDREGTPEIADIAMMQTKSLTYTFDGPGPYAFACHAPGHYEAGMRGTITLVG